MKILSCLIALLFVIGCSDRNSSDVIANNEQTLKGPGEHVGILADGRELVRYQIAMGVHEHDHYVYLIKNDKTIMTINHSAQQGKVTANHVEVIIDGQLYLPAPKEESNPNR